MSPIFISYSHSDAEYAHKLADTLQTEGFDVWIDARIDYGSQWPYEIQKQLDACEAFILIMTPRSFASEWVQSELQRAKRKLKPIFPMLLEGDEPWLSVESTQYYDVRRGNLPDPKFYSAIGRLAVRPDGQAVQLPADSMKKSSTSKPSVRSPKIRTEIVIAIIGAVATLLAAVVPIIWSSLSERSEPSPTDEATSPPSISSSEETPEPDIISLPSDITDPSDIPMSLVSDGEFIMGNNDIDEAVLAECQSLYPDCDRSWFGEEQPAHTVYLDAFYIDIYEVTNTLYAACVNESVCESPTDTGSETRDSYYGNSEFDHYPVIFVDWNMAKTYCEWRGARLPAEAEWEKAARGMDERTYPWGEEVDETYANYSNQIGDTTEAGDYESGKSFYGLYDMAGNVWEWVGDYYSETYYQDSPFSNPLGPDSGQEHVLRGGSWYDASFLIRTASRLKEPESVGNNFGFRCARDAP
jgi:formylglycine-generating enzyme required for sulfatase activity